MCSIRKVERKRGRGMMGKSFDEEWEAIHSTQEWGKYPAEHVIRFVARNFYKKNRDTIKILDFGCGGGAHAWYLAREGFDVYAFDGSESAVRKTKERLMADNLYAHLEVADALELQYEKDFFDAVIDNVSIYANRWKNIITMYEEIFDKLKDSGKLLTVCFGKKTSGCKSGQNIERDTYINITEGVLANRGTVHLWELEELEETLCRIGFRDIKSDTILYTDNGNQVEQYVVTAMKS